MYDKGAQITPVAAVQDALFLSRRHVGPDKLIRYTILLVLAAVIAGGGIVSDSTATVIGAMIVAPLATPIIAVGLAIVTVRPAQVARNTGIVVSSAAVVMAIGVAFGFLIEPFEYATNSQITGRVTPTLTDLLVAVATGLVGAYAQSRDDLSGVLPGVAIAISLVPPLVVVGVCLQGLQWAFAFGALTLFLANAIAMIVSGVVVFTIAGYGDYARADRRETRRALAVVVVIMLALVGPLGFFGLRSGMQAALVAEGQTAAAQWLAGSGYRLTAVTLTNDELNIKVLGPAGELPPTQQLADLFDAPLGQQVSVVVSEVSGRDIDLGVIS
jgi:uncharacterized hydrophobic protein (TIGR00271 family)